MSVRAICRINLSAQPRPAGQPEGNVGGDINERLPINSLEIEKARTFTGAGFFCCAAGYQRRPAAGIGNSRASALFNSGRISIMTDSGFPDEVTGTRAS